MRSREAMTVEQAEAVLKILTEECGAREDESFVYHQTTGHVGEYRFIGSLGFGGKFRRNTGRRADGTWGEMWYVDCYCEDETPARLAAIERANARLEELRQQQLPDND